MCTICQFYYKVQRKVFIHINKIHRTGIDTHSYYTEDANLMKSTANYWKMHMDHWEMDSAN